MLLPQTRGQFGDAAGRMNGDPLQHIDEVSVGIDAMQPAGDDQALHDADMFGAEFGPAEIPVFPTHRDHP